MSVILVKLPWRALQFVLWVAAVESFSSHFIGTSRYPLQEELGKQLDSVSSTSARRSTASQFFRTVSSIPCRRNRSLFSSRRPYDEADDGYGDFPSQKFAEMSEDEIRLRRMAKNSRKITENVEDYNYDDDNDSYVEEEDRGRRDNRARAENGLRKRSPAYDDFYDDEEDYDDEDEIQMAGNFWSNPTSNVDNPRGGIPRRGRQRQQRMYYDDDDDDDVMRRSPRRRPQQRDRQRDGRRRSTVPSSFGEPPKVLKDFYDQLFWYGFDADESAKVGDNTVFGGTKGKFNGFNYLLMEQDESRQNESRNRRSRPSQNSVRGLPPSRNGSENAIARDYDKSDYYTDDDETDDSDYYRVDGSRRERKALSSSEFTPPTDRASTRYDSRDDYDDYEDDDFEYTDNRRVNPRNSARNAYDDEYMDRRSGGRRRRRQQSSFVPDWSPLSMFESFLGIDREEMNYKAEVYDAKMGLGKRRRSSFDEDNVGRGRNRRRRPSTRRRSARDDPERPGYAYRYDATLDDESSPILDIDLADEDPESTDSDSKRRQLSPDGDDNDRKESSKTERSWEERQIAMDRVPPIDIMAWGPAGELPMSAREKAFMDAQEDIETARRKLNLMKKKESDAKEEIAILKVDAERQRLKLSGSPPEMRMRRDVEELRQIELDIDDASRDLRRSRTRVDLAREKLEELEERHHAIMSCYNIEQASSLVGETLNQFSASIQGTSANTSTLLSNEKNGNIIENVASGDDPKADIIEK